ncbi:ParB/RepB/Spo0J family partition protein [Polynucleobacter sp. MWH-CaK5]|jgi:ParB family transcriptional regulator, chromosome partitioning protein|uniref:ParB/RepB/Spo0J family partition protein n=1 Tax=Polynucleobacter sp. MWH-CaK5 TaxID=2689107 RepID=UPI001BFCD75D|nr:ParB/RepB/Spo0J family partition protein [Polynucleobacter sp. MWH-CaK5]QWD88928.1 ParB/RepB/Spo0J family partition protein [Polynucleobacter sp. MWH-CaK5]
MTTIKKKGLGRGLEALLGANDKSAANNAGGVAMLQISQLQAGKYQPRKNMVDASLQELSESIKEQGIMQPLLVRSVASGKYEIIAGERRFRAATMAGLKEVPVLIKQANDQATAAMALIENMQREDLNALEEANGLARLIEEFGYTHDKAAQAVGKSRSAVSNLLRLIQLAKPVQLMLAKGEIDMGHARALLPLEAAAQVSLAQKIIIQKLSVREAEQMATKLVLNKTQVGSSKKAKIKEDPDLRQLQEKLSDQLNLAVEIKQKRRGGEISIKFSQFDELDGFLKRLGID